jgi:hypothetical protein
MVNIDEPNPAAPVHERDRYPNVYDAFAVILDEGVLPNEPVVRFEATTLANGDITYRYWTKGADEPEGGVIRGEL